jgi:HK97 family phage prohead protease
MERKLFDLTACEVKMLDDESGMFEGYASVFNGVDAYGDTILPGAYAMTLENRARPIQMRWNHFGPVIGKWIKAEEDDKGLRVKGQIVLGHSVGRDAHALLKAGAINGLSIGYRIPSGGSEKDGKIRRLKRIDLVEISVVEDPADLGARVSDVKSALESCDSLKDIEAMLRDAAGFSRADACALVSRVKSLAHGERAAEAQTSVATLAASLMLHAHTLKMRK